MRNELNLQQYTYDFSVDGGAAGAIQLANKNNKDPIPTGAIVKSVTAWVETACTSGGSATVIWGNGADADGYSGATIAVASLTANAVFNGWDNGAALLWDDTNDHQIPYYVSSAANGAFTFTIATAALTAGKIHFFVEYYYPET